MGFPILEKVECLTKSHRGLKPPGKTACHSWNQDPKVRAVSENKACVVLDCDQVPQGPAQDPYIALTGNRVGFEGMELVWQAKIVQVTSWKYLALSTKPGPPWGVVSKETSIVPSHEISTGPTS